MEKFIRIESLLHSSSDRFLSEAQLQPNPALVAEGWQRRFTVDEERGKEVAELYAELGYEVRVEPVVTGEVADDCHDCHAFVALRLRTIYTRTRDR
ncbi:MAG TPA: hypothetical protein VE263_07295 [Candidatus Angelobacter sp.]|nr:hypothetical protein [Candidatus Angelobacter sp.]